MVQLWNQISDLGDNFRVSVIEDMGCPGPLQIIKVRWAARSRHNIAVQFGELNGEVSNDGCYLYRQQKDLSLTFWNGVLIQLPPQIRRWLLSPTAPRGRFREVSEKSARYAVLMASGIAHASRSTTLFGNLKEIRSSAMQCVLKLSEH